MNAPNFDAIASLYGLTSDFVRELHDKIMDKENFVRAIRMFVNGTLPYDVAMGKEPINVASVRHDVAKNLLNIRKLQSSEFIQAMEHQRKIVDYLHECNRFSCKCQDKDFTTIDVVYIKDGHLVAFAHFRNKQGGIYAANNELMPDYHWHPHDHLARLRKTNKSFYRNIKKAAYNSPKEWFDFNKIISD